MIVWLASYPRSGNTLLRTVLWHCFGQGSYNDEIDPEVRRNIDFSDSAEKRFGHMEMPAPWEAFYPEATKSAGASFVKTHLAPRDAQPAIYVVRDGRRVLVSYAKFHQRFQPARAKSLLELVVDDDYYGGWSEHHRHWTQRSGRTLVVKFEELVQASDELLRRIGQFIGHTGAVARWQNPFDEMKDDNPAFFRSGKLAWDGDAAWTPVIDSIFFELHGALMGELGYATEAQVEQARERLMTGERMLAALARSLAREKHVLEDVCRERQGVIEGLDRACRERLAVIEQLSAR